ncbi:sulfur carrier protein ThiS [Campylobacter sp. 19-13652]|uniref:sulfur carrier protein ThiS n=1 Tax=Campylobacter sp. 19-13652 TaxID=2840180 RepID=UPI001C740D57|nr:sulfur carrier protein ThiS [Campylobacter sp. 19-13652]BCX79619.1 hypothetical protein LBC_10810 [Campylobacter sp. 19-13652]
MIKITVNGDEVEVKEGISVTYLLTFLGFTPELVAIEREKEVLPRSTWNDEIVKDGENFEVVHFVGGG